MMKKIFLLIFLIVMSRYFYPQQRIGELNPGGTLVVTGQMIKPAGETLAFSDRPIDLVLSPDAKYLFVKNKNSVLIADVSNWKIIQELPYEKNISSSMHGIAINSKGNSLYITSSGSFLLEAKINKENKWEWNRKITISAKDRGESYPCGIAINKEENLAYIVLSRNNSVAIVDLLNGILIKEITVGVAPFDVVLSPDENTIYVSNWGGRNAKEVDRTMVSSGTPVVVGENDIPISGTISKIDLSSQKVTSEIYVGLHPSDLELSKDGSELFCANANSDNVSIINTKTFQVINTINVRPDSTLPFGSITNAIAVSKDGQTLYAANGGNNAIAVIDTESKEKVKGFIPAGWFPSAIVTDGKNIFIANTKGDGQRNTNSNDKKFFVKWHRGTVNKVTIPSDTQLINYSDQVLKDALVPQILKAFEKKQQNIKPVAVPKHPGEPSVFQHVFFVLKENRTYDQVFGDLLQANSDSSLCIYGRYVTPNHHALAEQFVLLDNYYCNGVVSADGHQWATQGITSDYQEKAWGEWTRSYDFGSDPLAFAPTNFIWDNVLLHGLSFRNYGEFDFPTVIPDTADWTDFYNDFFNKTSSIKFKQSVPMKSLHPYTSPDYPGWEMRIPDVYRLEKFLKEFAEFEKSGELPNFIFVYLPQDHTSGTKDDAPTPRAHIADNDLALGKLVDAISKSKFWKSSCIFVNEDDPQDGFDHVDGHRSLCLVISPYTKRGKVINTFYNQTSVLHTMENILGIPPMNQMDAFAPIMEDCFTSEPDFTPYTYLPSNIPLNEMNKQSSMLKGEEFNSAQASSEMNFTKPDRINDDTLNRILWHNAKGFNKAYPAEFAGAHGRGLKKLKLKFDEEYGED